MRLYSKSQTMEKQFTQLMRSHQAPPTLKCPTTYFLNSNIHHRKKKNAFGLSILREFFALHVFKLWKASFVLFHTKLCRQCQCLSLTHTQEKWSQSNKLWHLSSNITQAPSLQHKNSHKIILLVLFYTYVHIYIYFFSAGPLSSKVLLYSGVSTSLRAQWWEVWMTVKFIHACIHNDKESLLT